jgi:hemolysin-activating ACP:hemolysin acyltransferase
MGVAAIHDVQEQLRPLVKAASTARKGSSFAESFAQIVAVLMRDRELRKLPIAELEWMVLPALIAGQFAIAHAPSPVARPLAKARQTETGPYEKHLIPVAVALWARVSDNVDKILSENPEKQPRLRPADWTSGENIWVIVAGGDPRAQGKFIDQLVLREFKGKRVKARVRGSDGGLVVKLLGKA